MQSDHILVPRASVEQVLTFLRNVGPDMRDADWAESTRSITALTAAQAASDDEFGRCSATVAKHGIPQP